MPPYRYSVITSPGEALSDRDQADRLAFVQAHLGHCTADYLRERLHRYNMLMEAHTPDGERVALMFGHLTQLRGRRVSWPLLHLGLSVVHKDQRGRRLARELPTVLVRRALQAHPWKFLSLGIWLSAKCSSPASYQSLKRATEPFFYPRVSPDGELEAPPLALLHGVQGALGLPAADSPILWGANQDARFQLPEEDYQLDPSLLRFYQSHILPSQSEVLCFGLWHPLRLLPGAETVTRRWGRA
ncbi:MAG: hypothetical protein VKS61_15450 [Candidatus Sericytochromatia bacterium]|nr:hypothetical protein [Candidatus Sericytochromatia bacterium]